MSVHVPFRPEVLEARRQSWLGGVALAQPLSWWLLTAVAFAFAAAALLLLAFGSYSRRVDVAGEIVGTVAQRDDAAPRWAAVDAHVAEAARRLVQDDRASRGDALQALERAARELRSATQDVGAPPIA